MASGYDLQINRAAKNANDMNIKQVVIAMMISEHV